MSEISKCEVCGEPMPDGEEMFKFHGYSSDCPKSPLPQQPAKQKIHGLILAIADKNQRTVKMIFDTVEQANGFVSGIEADDAPNVKYTP